MTSYYLRRTCHCHAPETCCCWRVDSLLNPRSDWYCRRHLLLGYFLLSLDGEDSRITRFLQESLHTNPFWKIPDYNLWQFTFFKQYFTKSVGPGRFSAENLKVESRKDRQNDKLIWGGLGSLRFLQVNVYLKVFDVTKKSMFSDQTGKFPITSACGNKYIMDAVELDGNYIDCGLLQSRSAKSLTKAYQAMFHVRPYLSMIMAYLALHILYFVTNATNGLILNLKRAHLSSCVSLGLGLS